MLVKIKFEDIFVILYTSATFTKYACTLNNNLLYLTLNVLIDILTGIMICGVIKILRNKKKEQSRKRKF